MIPIPHKWFKRWMEYRTDKKLAEQCGLSVKDICVHDSDGTHYHKKSPTHSDLYIAPIWKCLKCGEFYE